MREFLGIRRSRLLVAACLLLVSIASHASAPAGRYTVATDTVTDTVTGRIWQRNVDASSYTWSQAQSYCSALILAGKPAGSWFLPGVRELQTLVDVRAQIPAIDGTAFPSTPASGFWSASGVVGSTTSAWVVYFNYGSTNRDAKTQLYRVRCMAYSP